MKTSLFFIILTLMCATLAAQTTPDWLWASAAGGVGSDYAHKISRDNGGNLYVTGSFSGSATFGATVLTSYGGDDVFVAKMSPVGNWLWAVKAGGPDADYGQGIVTDALGNSYITGYFQNYIQFGVDFQYTEGSFDFFVAKLDTFGNWVWSNSEGGGGNDMGNGIALGPGGYIYVTGSYSGAMTVGNFNLNSSGGTDVFIAIVDANGQFSSALSAGGGYADSANAISVDDSGRCYVTGYYTISATFGSTTLTGAGSFADVFVARLSATGTWDWALSAGGSLLDTANSIAHDANGNCYITGNFNGLAYFGATGLTASGTDFFVGRVLNSGAWDWAIRGGGSLADAGNGVTVDASGNCLVTGFFQGSWDLFTHSITSNGARDVFVGKLDPNGSWLWIQQGGGLDNDFGRSLTLDTEGTCYVCGYFQSGLGASVFGPANLSSAGAEDVFVAELGYGGITTPQIIVMGSLSSFSTEVGIPSDPQSYQLYGQYLTGDILITPPAGFEVSVDGGMSYSATASVPPTYYGMVNVRLTGAYQGSFDGNISHTSPGAAEVNLFVEGSVYDIPAFLEVVPSSWDFGPVPLGEPQLTTVTLNCSGSFTNSVTIESFILDTGNGFQLYNPPPTPLTIWGGTSEYVDVVFNPTTLGPKLETLYINEMGTAPHEVQFSGVGAPPNNTGLDVSPTSHDFGNSVNVGSTADLSITVALSPTYPLSDCWLQSAAISGDPSFVLDPTILNQAGQASVLPYNLTTGDHLVFMVHFNPTDITTQNAVVTFTDEFGYTVTTSLSGTGATPPLGPLIEVTPSPIDVTMGQNDLFNGEFSIANLGDETLSWNISPGYSPPFMSINTTTGSVAPGGNELVSYEINSNGLPLGLTTDSVTISSNDATHPSVILPVNVTVTGSITVPSLVANPTSHDFGSTIMPGESGSVDISITQNPAWPYSTALVNNAVLTGDPVFALGPDILDATGAPITLPYSLEGTGMAVFTVEFEPWVTTYQSAVLNVFGESDTLMVLIEAFGGSVNVGPVISVVPSIVNVSMNTNAYSSGHITVFNTGDENLAFNINSTTIPPEISLFPQSGTVAPGDSTLLQYAIQSTSLAVGSYTRIVQIHSNDPNHTPWDVTFNIDVTATPEQVDFVGVPLSGHAPLEVQFTDQSLAPAAGWRWDFENDGIVDSYAQNPLHTYMMPGLYTVKLVLINPTGVYLERIKDDYIFVTNNPPQVQTGAPTEQEFMEDTTGGPYDLTEVFYDPDNDPLTYTVQSSAHISGYAVPGNQVAPPRLYLNAAENWYGTENIVLVAQDPYNGSATHTLEITVLPVNDAPVLSVPDILYFIRYSTLHVDFADYITDPDNNMAELSIQLIPLGPGEINFEYTPVNLPDQLGQFTVDFSTLIQFDYQEQFRIIVNDHVNRTTAQQEFFVHVLHHFTPVADVDASFQFTGQTVEFNDATLGNPDNWLWDFGDGATSDEQYPSHAYTDAGTYTVQLTLWNSEANLQENLTASVSFQLTMQGTAVNPGFIPPTWTPLGSPYNLFGNIVIPPDDSVHIDPNVEINLFGDNPLTILGSINATLARFRSQTGTGFWGGLRFSGPGGRQTSQFNDCEIVDALLPLDIEGQSPHLDGIIITVTDTTAVQDSVAIRIRGASAAQLNDVEILNYKGGIMIQTDSDDRSTPTLTNIRVRNSQEGSRQAVEGSTGCTIRSDAVLHNIEIEYYETGLRIEAPEGDRDVSTPTLTNIRVRNSQEGSRDATQGLVISGAIAPQIDSLYIDDVLCGIMVSGGEDVQRTTPTLTNIRVRNSQEGSRTDSYGMKLENVPGVIIDTAEFEGYATGISISNQQRDVSTPTLTNIRVRNSQEGSREENLGIDIQGAVTAVIDDAVVEDYAYGIKYFGALTRTTTTPTLTNIRVRNSQEGSRIASIGIQIRDLGRIVMENDSIVGYNVGLEILNSEYVRDVSTPTLTNIRVRNSQEGSRYDNVGIYLGPGIGGSLGSCILEEARIGIFIADGNRTLINPNQIFNCEVGIKAAGLLPNPLRRQLIVLESPFYVEHQDWQFTALDLNLAGPWIIENNTLHGYPRLLKAIDAGIAFTNNIGWTWQPMPQPFELTNSVLGVNYSDLRSQYPGVGNISLDPEYADWENRDYGITYNSPCIDAGSPILPPDSDGSVSDIGAYPYLHRASLIADQRFIQPGDLVHFTNTSLGHDQPFSISEWDLNNDGEVEATTRDWQYTFMTPGIYNLKLKMSTGSLEDMKIYEAIVVVQDSQLQPPQNPVITRQQDNIQLSWDAVTQTVGGIPINVEFYVVYYSSEPAGFYDLAGITEDFETTFIHTEGALRERSFYVVIGYAGTRGELMQYIQQHPRIRVGENSEIAPPRSKR